MKINFLIPTTGLTGGIKVIFEHANRLARKGHQIHLIYPYVLCKDANFKGKILGAIKKIRRFLLRLIKKDKVKWFTLDSQINLIRVWNLAEKNIPDADITVATANETADWLIDYFKTKGEKIYFIQDYEIWTRDTKKVEATYEAPLKKIVISSWLKNLLENKFNQRVLGIVPDGVDAEMFINREKIFNKNKKILMQYHILEKKGFFDGLKAYQIAKQKHPEIELILFGAYKPPKSLLKIAKFYYQPNKSKLKELYALADIFLWPSRLEGFGIPPMEAMANKCAVICTDTGAVRDYADENSAIILPVQKPDLMAEKLIELIENEGKIKNLTKIAFEKVKNFNWQSSTKLLEEILFNISK